MILSHVAAAAEIGPHLLFVHYLLLGCLNLRRLFRRDGSYKLWIFDLRGACTRHDILIEVFIVYFVQQILVILRKRLLLTLRVF